MEEQVLFFNGINPESGDYLKPARSFRLSPGKRRTPRLVRDDVNIKNLSEAGWGIIFARGDRRESAIREAMQPLLDRRKNQASLHCARRYQEFTGDRAYRPGEEKQDFLTRLNIGPGTLDPDRLPYYLLLVGDPKDISFPFQYQLDVPCAVGRIHFETLDEYERYARSVVEAEIRPPERPRKAVLFGPRHLDDPPTDISVEHLLEPLTRELKKWPDWETSVVVAEQATKSRLEALLGGAETPSLLFTGGHGLGFDCGHSRQKDCQGALLCQEWRGQGHVAPRECYFSADDVSESASLSGLISFHFACYSAGTPAFDGFSPEEDIPIAPEPFLARLPQRMLAHPRGGALAVVGHVDQACQSSFLWHTAGSQVQTFAHTLWRLQDDYPIGAAMEPMNLRYTEISSELFTKRSNGKADEWEDFLNMACHDARNYVVVGDPAVRLPAARKPEKKRVLRGG
jgi:hypothetical protein